MNLKLKLFKDELPELTIYSNSYGGQWSSDWIIIFEPNGTVKTTKFTVSWSIQRKDEPLSLEDKNCGTITGSLPWKFTHANSAWCYSKDAANLFGVEE